MNWRRRNAPTDQPVLVQPPDVPRGVVQICHPDWRGVRESARAFGDPVVTAADLRTLVDSLANWKAAGVATTVIQGWPPGADVFAQQAAEAGLTCLAVFHSAPSQHGVDGGEAEAVTTMLDLTEAGIISRLATVKAGVAPAFKGAGFEVTRLENRVPDVVAAATEPDGSAPHVGIFLFPMWRKNVTTQVLAAVELGGTTHVMTRPDVGYLREVPLLEHGELDRPALLAVLAGMDLSLNVTLSECHPMTPMESYRLGVPCLMSRTSSLFADDPDLYELTTVAHADDPHAIASAARTLLANSDDAVERANGALDVLDARARASWLEFTAG